MDRGGSQNCGVSLHPYNDERKWASAGIFKRPEFDVAGYQKRIDRVVGLSPSGQSIVRLMWAWDVRKWENTAWDEFGVATAGEWRQTYRALSIGIGNDDYVDISPPRWILEERFEPEQIAHSWELTRYRRVTTEPAPPMCRFCKRFGMWVPLENVPTAWLDVSKCKDDKMWFDWWHPEWSEGHLLACRFCQEFTELASIMQDVWGEAPRGGWYNLLPHVGIIAQHQNGCCQRRWDESREICYGQYKEPGGKEIKRLRKAIALRDKEAATNPHIRPDLDEVALQQAKVWGLQMMRDREVSKRTELAEITQANRRSHLVYG